MSWTVVSNNRRLRLQLRDERRRVEVERLQIERAALQLKETEELVERQRVAVERERLDLEEHKRWLAADEILQKRRSLERARREQALLDEAKRAEELERYRSTNVVISSPEEMVELLDKRLIQPQVYEPLFLPVIFDLLRLVHLRDAFRLTKEERDDEVVFRGMFISRFREVRYCADRIHVATYAPGVDASGDDASGSDAPGCQPVWSFTINDVELATYFRTLLSGSLPDFSERVFGYCYFILSLYTSCEGDPYYFYGDHMIHGSHWNQIYRDGNEIRINGFYCFVHQRELLYAGILWSQRHRQQLLDEVISVKDLRKLVEGYLKG